jgi:hypothetical protein
VALRGVHILLTRRPALFTACSRLAVHHHPMGDFLAVVGTIGFTVAMLGLVWALERV